MNIYIIGSMSNYDKIQEAVQCFERQGQQPRYAQPSTDNLPTCIERCYTNIDWANVVIAVPKDDGTFGNGTTYEIAYAKHIGKYVIKYDGERL